MIETVSYAIGIPVSILTLVILANQAYKLIKKRDEDVTKHPVFFTLRTYEYKISNINLASKPKEHCYKVYLTLLAKNNLQMLNTIASKCKRCDNCTNSCDIEIDYILDLVTTTIQATRREAAEARIPEIFIDKVREQCIVTEEIALESMRDTWNSSLYPTKKEKLYNIFSIFDFFYRNRMISVEKAGNELNGELDKYFETS